MEAATLWRLVGGSMMLPSYWEELASQLRPACVPLAWTKQSHGCPR